MKYIYALLAALVIASTSGMVIGAVGPGTAAGNALTLAMLGVIVIVARKIILR